MAEDGRARGGRELVRPGLWLVAAGAALGLALEFHFLGWTSIPGNSCGGRYRPCPEGTTPTILLAFLFSFAGFFALTGAVIAFRKVRPGKLLPAVLVLVGAPLALWPGWQAHVWLRGPVLDPVWEADRDRPATVRGRGTWTVGGEPGTVVRVRDDALTAYGVRDGERAWTLKAPPRASVCGMSDTVVDGIGLVAFGPHEKPCDTVWGVDVRAGRTVWERRISGVPDFTSASDGLLTAAAGTAVVLTDGAVRGYGLADGEPRWTAELTEAGGTAGRDGVRCRPQVASASDRSGGAAVRAVVECAERSGDFRSAWLVTLDGATGEERDRRELPVESSVSTAMVVSADPFTLLLRERDERGTAAVLAYGGPDGGGEPVLIPLTADEEDLVVAPEYGFFAARPALLATVDRDALVVAVRQPGASDPEGVSAYSLRDGRRLWHTGLGHEVTALAPAGRGGVAVLGDNGRLWTLATGDGERRGEDDGVTLRGVSPDLDLNPQLVRAGGTWIVVNSDGDRHPPLLALGP
ncbi:PQQ-binding-like beta-propeller repeat protein [Streptomyces sp. TRM 70361]|uniref:outer membrane protein assembly factor BamB family protein n=1 Tax=Streptomyces sp. TRM 70361 TaxID=3116553 RepID=UPI002E7BBBF0|nr:PQQ-binding-like beta-propeller repeat protein [Streptomyces sp. TRM 70361]MEE1941641.1 PQQ-binding-like beta-propeller repeat protein [Streptomyces sp. TRM 70361]